MSFVKNLVNRLSGGRLPRPADRLSLDSLAASEPQWLIIGLGNPGSRYASTRHNVGYMAAEDLLAEFGEVLSPVKGSKLLAAALTIGDTPVAVVRSTTFMNLSGEPIAPLAQALGIAPERIIVIHDELDLPSGKIRLKLGGNENGHNGLKSLSEQLGTREYLRVRIGISRPPQGVSVPDYVLSSIAPDADLDGTIASAAQAARLIVTDGLPSAQNQIHSR